MLLGVTGSIAAFKACQIASDLTKTGCRVRVIMTDATRQFVGTATFDALTHSVTRTDMFPETEYALSMDGDGTGNHDLGVGVSHIEDAKWADIAVIAPATANIIAKLAAGLADDYLSTTMLAATCPKLVCPAMNVHMYENPATQRNLAVCRQFGYRLVEPETGILACQDVGKGRLANVATIERAIVDMLQAALPVPMRASAQTPSGYETAGECGQTLSRACAPEFGRDEQVTGIVSKTNADDTVGEATTDGNGRGSGNDQQPLAGLNALITAGPTQEPLDPVRYITNHSTGKMGYALAQAAKALGAAVTLVSGPVALPEPTGVNVVQVLSAEDMFEAVQRRLASADIAVMAAAVGDFRPEHADAEKIKKQGRADLTVRLVSNPDILVWLGAHQRTDGSQALCGFAMETEDLIHNAAKKLLAKRCDMLVANDLREPGAGFATDTNVVTILTPAGNGKGSSGGENNGGADDDGADDNGVLNQQVHTERLQQMPKTQLAVEILRRLAGIRQRATV
ncbi:MAG: bifunctional phosphopantothenoylcysteine decarboxylase/phosphopantothenate synthase [Bifidobacterium subtile]|nr:bifunctional phosphopantothenoylcysteine decarboxylase/phosphopantothenate synthase [Bifidobacterium subtile]MCI1258812.1 bifunctional phosphopantothenoylcysteine decarboxylase/phosphopantothenate synthase [Bifidobacterium subtile]